MAKSNPALPHWLTLVSVLNGHGSGDGPLGFVNVDRTPISCCGVQRCVLCVNITRDDRYSDLVTDTGCDSGIYADTETGWAAG